MSTKPALVLSRRIERLNHDFARAKATGGNLAPFFRRARSLSTAFLAEKERGEAGKSWTHKKNSKL